MPAKPAKAFPFILLAIALAPSPVMAMSVRFYSVEWWTNISDAIVIAKATGVTAKAPPDGANYQMETVTFEPTTLLSGVMPSTRAFDLRFMQVTGPDKQIHRGGDSRVAIDDLLLIFVGQRSSIDKPGVVFWVNLSHPSGGYSPQCVYDNDRKVLKRREEILSLVRARIYLGMTRHERGIIVQFETGKDQIITGRKDFVITADPEFKAGLLRDLHSNVESTVEDAIYNLVSYPGPDTKAEIRKFLTSSVTAQWFGPDASGKKHSVQKYYPLRQAAYLALYMMGENLDLPEGYRPEVKTWLFDWGFEDPKFFPAGKWKRYPI